MEGSRPWDSEMAMRRAIELAKLGLGFVAPNPPVGCVILDQHGRLLAEGYHTAWGKPHAEVEALRKVKDPSSLKGAHLFVTLEPCSHFGKTPPCAETLARLPLASVTYGLLDPNPKVSGRGVHILQKAGLHVIESPILRSELQNLAEIFFCNMIENKAFCALKVASSLDGMIALKSGESQWITGPEAREHVHFLRAVYDAVLVGVGTLLADNPNLNSRLDQFKHKSNSVVLVDPRARSAPSLKSMKIFASRKTQQVYFVTRPEYATSLGLDSEQVITQCWDGETLDWMRLREELYKKKINSVLIEGGAKIHASLIQQNQMQRIYSYIAPKILGSGLSWTQEFSISELKQAPVLRDIETTSLGPDILISGRI